MANLKASIKDIRKTKKRTVFNDRIRNRYRKAVKAFGLAITAKDKKVAKTKLEYVYKMLDKAAKLGVIKPGTADRNKSRLTHKLNQLTARNVKTANSNT